jgi:hypothetical protein
VLATFKRLQAPAWEEGFDEIRVVTTSGTEGFVVEDWTKEQGDPPRPE